MSPPTPPEYKKTDQAPLSSGSSTSTSPLSSKPTTYQVAHHNLVSTLAMENFVPAADHFAPTMSPLPPSANQRQIHRNRASYSCHACRRRKVKCDRQHPVCGCCQKMGERCIYADNSGKGSKDKSRSTQSKKRRKEQSYDADEEGLPSSSDATQTRQTPDPKALLDQLARVQGRPLTGPELQSRVSRIAEIVDGWYKAANEHGPPRDTPTPATNGNQLDAPKTPAVGFAKAVKEHPPIPAKDQDVDSLAIGHLSIQGFGRSRYVGGSFWGLLSNEITELNQVLATGPACPIGGPAPNTNAPHTPPDSDQPAPEHTACHKLKNIDKSKLLNFDQRDAVPGEDPLDILRSLPSKEICDRLYESFMQGVHPVMPLIHGPTFAAHYQSFWEWFPDNVHNPPSKALIRNPTFFPLLHAVLYAGMLSMSNTACAELFAGRPKSELTNNLYAATTSSLSTTQFPRSPTLNSLAAFLIVQTCLIREEEPLTSCSFIGMAMRVAQQMGLHRDGSLFGLGEVECEIRRRLWWHIVYLDIQGAIAAGLPPLGGSGDDQFDTKMVSELRDEYIGTEGDLPDTPDSSCATERENAPASLCRPKSRSSPAMLLAIGRYETTLVLRKISARLLGIKPPTRQDVSEMSDMIQELKLQHEEKISRIPAKGLPEIGFFLQHEESTHYLSPSCKAAEKEEVFNTWARIMLSMFSDRAYGVLYQPFLKSTKSKLWVHARHCAIRTSHIFLQKFIHLARAPAYQPYRWFCPGTYQPLHTTMILLLDLYERPFATEAVRSRVFVNEVFALFDEHGNYTTEDGEAHNRPLMEGGREAWKMLSRLRKKGYAKAGLKEDGTPAEDYEKRNTAETREKEREREVQWIQAHYCPNEHGMHVAGQFPEVPAVPIDKPQEIAHEVGGMREEEKGQKAAEYDGEMHSVLDDGGTTTQIDRELADLQGEDFDWKEWDSVFGRFVEMEDVQMEGDGALNEDGWWASHH